MSLASNQNGQVLIEYFKVKEREVLMYLYHPIKSIMIFIKCEGKLLMVHEADSHEFRVPSGTLEFDEPLRHCARRALYEQSGQVVDDLEFLGIFRILDTRRNQFLYRFAYLSEIEDLNPTELQIKLWDLKEEIGEVDEVELKMLRLVI